MHGTVGISLNFFVWYNKPNMIRICNYPICMQSSWFDFDFKYVFHFALDNGKPRLFRARAVDPETLITVDSSPLIVF